MAVEANSDALRLNYRRELRRPLRSWWFLAECSAQQRVRPVLCKRFLHSLYVGCRSYEAMPGKTIGKYCNGCPERH